MVISLKATLTKPCYRRVPAKPQPAGKGVPASAFRAGSELPRRPADRTPPGARLDPILFS